MASSQQLMSFDLEFTYFVAPKDVPQYVAALWAYLSLPKNRKQLADWDMSVPEAHGAANGPGSDKVALTRFAVRFTHKCATYEDVKQARVIFDEAYHTGARIVWKLYSAPPHERGLLQYDKMLRQTYWLQNNPTSTSGYWGEWGLHSVYYPGTTPDDGSPVSELEKFLDQYEERMPQRAGSHISKTLMNSADDMVSGTSQGFRRVREAKWRLEGNGKKNHGDVQELNSRIRDAIQSHCNLLDKIQVYGEGDMGFDARVAKAIKATDSLVALAEDQPIRTTPWWKRIVVGRGHVEKLRDSTTKLRRRAWSIEEEAQGLIDMFPQLDAALKQHACISRKFVLCSHIQVQWPKLAAILDHPDADEQELNDLFGPGLRAMQDSKTRQDQLAIEHREFKKGDRALRSEEKKFVKRAKKAEAKLDKFWRDYRRAGDKFRKEQARTPSAQKEKELDWSSESEYSGETLCDKY